MVQQGPDPEVAKRCTTLRSHLPSQHSGPSSVLESLTRRWARENRCHPRRPHRTSCLAFAQPREGLRTDSSGAFSGTGRRRREAPRRRDCFPAGRIPHGHAEGAEPRLRGKGGPKGKGRVLEHALE